jgi:hypothetical protein
LRNDFHLESGTYCRRTGNYAIGDCRNIAITLVDPDRGLFCSPNGHRRDPSKEDKLPDVSKGGHYGAAITAQVVLLAYFELCILIPLGRWNDQPGNNTAFSSGNMILGAAIGGAQLSLLIGTVWRLKPLLWFGLLGDTVWLLLHIYSLWVPYVLGATPQYAKMYARVWSRTTKLLPNFGNHLAPDAMHIFIDVFVVAVIVTLVSYLRSLQAAGTSTER